MKVKELIAELQTMNPDDEVIGYDNILHRDFTIHGVIRDEVIDTGISDGFHKLYSLQNFFVNGVSVCDKEPVGTKIVVIH